MWVPFLHINFIVECEWNELVEYGAHLLKVKKKVNVSLNGRHPKMAKCVRF